MKTKLSKALLFICSIIITISVCGCTSYEQQEHDSSKGKKADEYHYSMIFAPDTTDEITKEQLKSAIAVFKTRLDTYGYTEYTIKTTKDNKIEVSFPDKTDTQQISALLCAKSELVFTDKDGNVILNGDDIVRATSSYEDIDSSNKKEYYINLFFSDSGAEKFAKATEIISEYPSPDNYIAIVIDGVAISVPRVNERIDSNECIITGDFDKESSKILASQINSGRLPISFTFIENEATS